MNKSTAATYLWSRVDVRGKNECWPWMKRRNRGGYGVFKHSGFLLAHRLAFHVAHPTIDIKGKPIRHRCDNPPCCNPAHLALGTPSLNNADRLARVFVNTQPKSKTKNKLSRKAKLFIQSSPLSCRCLAVRFKVSPQAISYTRKHSPLKHLHLRAGESVLAFNARTSDPATHAR